jgi:chromosome partitioning protein
MKTLVLANQKGGVGKSAIATQLAHYLHQLGHSVIVVDLDHQQNTSRPLQANSNVAVASFSSSTIFEAASVPDLPPARFVLVAGDDRLSTLERQPDQHNIFASRFRAALRTWDGFDVCLVDTNPNPDIRYAAALISAQHVLAPIQLNQEAIEGIAGLFGHPRYGIARITATLNPDLNLLGILPNMVEATPFQKANLQLMMSKYGSRLLSRAGDHGTQFGFIQKRTAIAEAQAAGQFLPNMAKTSARDTWREVKPVFDMIVERLALAPLVEVPA